MITIECYGVSPTVTEDDWLIDLFGDADESLRMGGLDTDFYITSSSVHIEYNKPANDIVTSMMVRAFNHLVDKVETHVQKTRLGLPLIDGELSQGLEVGMAVGHADGTVTGAFWILADYWEGEA